MKLSNFAKVFPLLAITFFTSPALAQRFSEWLAPVSVGAPVNTTTSEFSPFLTKDGLSLYFASNNRPGGYGGIDIWVSQRSSVAAAWSEPQNLGLTINGPYDEAAPFISIDGHTLYFQSNRPGAGHGGGDLYVARRHNKRDDFGWQAPVNLGSGVNSASDESSPWLFEDDQTGAITLYFTSNREGGPGPVGSNAPGFAGQQGSDIYASTYGPDEQFGPATLVTELSTASFDNRPSVSRDGLEIYFESNRPGSILNAAGQPSFDLWVARREATSDSWSAPVNVGPVVNTNGPDRNPALSFDGVELPNKVEIKLKSQGGPKRAISIIKEGIKAFKKEQSK
jgi:hypothetical protein